MIICGENSSEEDSVVLYSVNQHGVLIRRTNFQKTIGACRRCAISFSPLHDADYPSSGILLGKKGISLECTSFMDGGIFSGELGFENDEHLPNDLAYIHIEGPVHVSIDAPNKNPNKIIDEFKLPSVLPEDFWSPCGLKIRCLLIGEAEEHLKQTRILPSEVSDIVPF